MQRFAIRQTLAACAVMTLALAGTLHAADELPKADTILDKSIEATGGKAAFEKMHSSVITGSLEVPAAGVKGSMTITKAEPDKSIAEVQIEGFGTVKQGYDGSVAWEINPMQGARIKDGDEKAAAKLQAFFHEEKWRDLYKKVETVGSDTVDGKDCYKVVLTPNEGSAMTEYFDKKTGLLTKATMTLNTQMGEIAAETMFSDYRKEGDLLVAHKIQQSAAGQEFTMTFDNYKYNVDLPKDKFALPDDIKALVNKK